MLSVAFLAVLGTCIWILSHFPQQRFLQSSYMYHNSFIYSWTVVSEFFWKSFLQHGPSVKVRLCKIKWMKRMWKQMPYDVGKWPRPVTSTKWQVSCTAEASQIPWECGVVIVSKPHMVHNLLFADTACHISLQCDLQWRTLSTVIQSQ